MEKVDVCLLLNNSSSIQSPMINSGFYLVFALLISTFQSDLQSEFPQTCDPVFSVSANGTDFISETISTDEIISDLQLVVGNDCATNVEGITYNVIVIAKNKDPQVYFQKSDVIEKNKLLKVKNFPIRVFIEEIKWSTKKDGFQANSIVFQISE